MGQAKQRGNFAQRQAEGIARRIEREEKERSEREARRLAFEARCETERQARARQAERQRQVRPSTHSAFGRRHSMPRSLLMAAAMVALATPTTTPASQPSPALGWRRKGSAA